MLDKSYDPKTLEGAQYALWEKAGYFKPKGHGRPYCIMIPPPNVTGSLHMGHAFQQTLMDVLIRSHRMKQDNTLWQVGTDHAGIATQMVVERQLNAQNISRHDLGREAFVERIWEWKAESGGNITRQLRRMGASVDWSTERFTMDEGLSKAVQTVFIQLYREGLIYKGKRLGYWDPVLHTAVSDLEVESTEEQGSLWHIRYPLADNSNSYIVVATTRPETLLGDVAVAVHPEDTRYQAYIGKWLCLPLTDRLIPIIADDTVLQEFGTGCVKITPAHDFNDYAIGQRHHLDCINIFSLNAKLNENAPPAYRGLDRFVARAQIIKDLEVLHLLEKTEAHSLIIPRGDRSGAILEPMLTDQWYVKIDTLAKPAIEAVQSGKIQFIPENWSNTYFDWMHKIQDWCISRQLWWGHRIPAWYDDKDNVYVGESEEAIRKEYQLSPEQILTQDPDVLDTWFSSALWPFSTLGWPEQTEALKTFYPTQVLMTGFDIIFFWVARMIMFGLKFTGKIPFHEVYITPLIYDQDGQKMSKTKGNVLDPIDLIDGIDLDSLIIKRTADMMQPQLAKRIAQHTRTQFPNGIPSFGTDALRFAFCAFATPSRIVRFDLARIEGYKHFCNKLWNASRYVLTHLSTEMPPTTPISLSTFSLPDRWIVTRWQKTKQLAAEHLATYRFDLLAQTLYDFTWYEYCDWYLELSKPILSNTAGVYSIEEQVSTRYTLATIHDELLRTLHPLIPYITEAIWQKLKPFISKAHPPSIMLAEYPRYQGDLVDAESEAEIDWLQLFILGVRNIRGEMNIPPKKILPIQLWNADTRAIQRIQQHEALLKAIAKIESPVILKATDPRPAASTALVGTLEILVPIMDIIDVQAEITRLKKEIEKHAKELTLISTQLNNPNFVLKAPKALVESQQKRVEELRHTIAHLEKRQQEIQPLEMEQGE